MQRRRVHETHQLERKMEIDQVTWQGPPIDDDAMLDRLPTDLRTLLTQINGFIQFSGGLHIRGASTEPDWHSLRAAWDGKNAFWRHYTTILKTDVPFGQDALGDQFFLRDSRVVRLSSESDETEDLNLPLFGFMRSAQTDPIDFLALHPLQNHLNCGGTLEPGQLLSVTPPFVVDSGENGHSYRAVSTNERVNFLAKLAEQIRDIPDGMPIKFEVT